ncbi:uncharacterized protein YkwD [Murinocardiopsis flavida]|uniref:Uncharacterized protein YkwD n=1 Tax=Murinocardiopsis flavida TaxID=645275 RepID=A0A2P8D283_9ACTN|nr:CAP domain-containing protein [Murinocardiopsis flavida]PSK91334.1 uncharacterized protein YkwD [Murinocardiopsis flavida]
MSGARRYDRNRSPHGSRRGARRRPVRRSTAWRGPVVGGLLALPVGAALAAAMIVASAPDSGAPAAANGAQQAPQAVPDDVRTPEDFFPSPTASPEPAPTQRSAPPKAATGDGAEVEASVSPRPSESGGDSGGSRSPAPDPGGGSGGGDSAGVSALAKEVVRLTNKERADAGCAPLRVDDRLTAAAQGHSKDMDLRDYMDHISPDGKGPGDRSAAEGYDSWSGENVASGQRTAAQVVESWMDSKGHRDNILNCDSKAIGVGEAGFKWTQLFGSE